MIEFRSVKKVYDGKKEKRTAIKDASFKIETGEFVFLTGASGAGKSTILKMIYKAEMVSEGEVMIFGENIAKIKTKNLRRNMGFVFQDFQLLSNKTAYENVAYVLACLGKNPFKIRKTAMEALDRLGIADLANALPDELSGGQQQRVAIARAFVTNPRILICDEPTNNVDPENARIIMDFLKKANEEQDATIIMATHDLALVEQMKKRIITVNDGIVTSMKKEEEFFDLASYIAGR